MPQSINNQNINQPESPLFARIVGVSHVATRHTLWLFYFLRAEMAWIESHQTLEKHPKLLKLISLTNWSKNETIGILHRLWWWVLSYAEDGNLSKYSSTEVALALDLNETFDKTKLFEVLKEAKFLDSDLKIHDWLDFAGRYLKAKYASSNPKKLLEIQRKYKSYQSKTKVKPKSDENSTPLPTYQPLPTNLNQPTFTTQKLTALYCESFKALYGKNPIITKKDAGIAKRLVVIPEIDLIMQRFFESKDKFIIQNRHSLNIVESQINKLLVGELDKFSDIKAWLKEKEAEDAKEGL